jgi:hypothetical protein
MYQCKRITLQHVMFTFPIPLPKSCFSPDLYVRCDMDVFLSITLYEQGEWNNTHTNNGFPCYRLHIIMYKCLIDLLYLIQFQAVAEIFCFLGVQSGFRLKTASYPMGNGGLRRYLSRRSLKLPSRLREQ